MRKILLAASFIGAMSQTITATPATTEEKATVSKAETQTVEIKDIKVGEGAGIHAGQRISVHYTGTLQNGTVFDCSRKRGQPFEFIYGVGQVIPGWEEGLKTMKVGGQRVITIPPELGYGSSAVGGIPANSTLVFDVELLGTK